jgi:hemolysin activation/secretion protein
VASGGVVIPELSGPQAPKGADRLKVKLTGVAVEGEAGAIAADADRVAARNALTSALEGKTVTVAEIFQAAREFEAAYGRAGYVLTRVVVPAQSLKNGGTLRIVVIDGFIERLETRELPPRVKARIEAVLAPLVGRRSVELRRIERALMLASDTPGVVMKSTLAPGTQRGGSVLIVEARQKLVTAAVSVDNTLGASLGSINSTLALQLNSAFGLGEQFYGQAGGYPRFDGTGGYFTQKPINRQLSAGVVMPLGTDGLGANLEAIRTDSAPNASAGQQFYSTFERYSARLRYAFIRSRAFNVSSELAFDAEQETLSSVLPVAAPVSLDRLRVFRDTTDISGVTPWGAAVSGRLIASIGIDGLGARSLADATPILPLSRQGADAAFQKLEYDGHYGQLLLDHLALDLFARAMMSFGKPLLRAEQIGLVGGFGLSAFDAGTFQGDSGAVGRAELSSPWNVDLGAGAANLSPYAFGDAGTVWLMKPTAVERRETSAGSAGVGLHLGAAPNPPGSPNANALSGVLDQALLSLEWGHQYRNDGIRAGDRFTFSSTLQF